MTDPNRSSTFFVLVLHKVGVPTDVATQAIAQVLGLGAYEARLKANVASPGPVIAATSADEETLEIYAETLTERGVPAFVLGNSATVAPFAARRVALTNIGLIVESRDGAAFELPYGQATLLMQGMGITDFQTSQTETSRKLSLGRAVLSGGLLLTKKVEKVRTQTASQRSGFLLLYFQDDLILLDEESLQYDGLGDQMKATRSLNFAFVCQRLKAECIAAVFDEQLMNRARQVQILGPKLSPESHLELLTSILATVLLSRWPGRSLAHQSH